MPERVALDDMTVAMAASHELFSVDESADAAEVEAVMRERKVRRVPVIDRQGFPLGVVTLADLLREATRDPPYGVGVRDVVAVLSAIGEPMRPRAHESIG